MNNSEFQIIPWQCSDYKKALELRDRILRRPLGLSIHDEDLAAEANMIHGGLYARNSMLACVCAVAVSDTKIKIRQMAVESEEQGKGYGRKLMLAFEEHLQQRGFDHLTMHARLVMAGFYEKLGYQKVGNIFEEVTIPHIEMEKELSRKRI